MDNHLVMKTSTVSDWGVAVLALAGEPLSSEEIHVRLPRARSLGALKNALSLDDRVHRTDRDRWSLRSWGRPEYAGIRSAIDEILDRDGGEAQLPELVREISEAFSVTPNSIQAYAATFPFETSGGTVRRSSGERREINPYAYPRLYRRADSWLLRVTVTPDQLRGSGFPVPQGIAQVVDLAPGATSTLHSPLGDQAIYWTGLQVSCGTIRRFLNNLDAEPGEPLLLRFDDNGFFDVERPLPATEGGWANAARLAGAPVDAEPLSYLAGALGLDGTARAADVLDALVARGERDMIRLLQDLCPPGEPRR